MKLLDILVKKIKIKNYVEFNSPFMGLLINFSQEYNYSLKEGKMIFSNSNIYHPDKLQVKKKLLQKKVN